MTNKNLLILGGVAAVLAAVAFSLNSSSKTVGAKLNGEKVLPSLNVADVAVMMKYIAKWSGLDIDLDAADVTNDGRVNLLDASKILKHLARWDVAFGE